MADIDHLPRFEIRPLSEEDGGGWLIEFPEYPGCMADGATPEEAIREGQDALASYVGTLRELGRRVPTEGDAFSGQWRQRVPKSMHAALVRRADAEGVSLNTLVTVYLAEALGRRAAASTETLARPEAAIQIGRLTIDLRRRLIEVDGRRVHVTGKEYAILELLALHKGTAVTSDDLLKHLYRRTEQPELKMIDVLVCKLRKKIATATGGPHYIMTVWGHGYRLNEVDVMSGSGELQTNDEDELLVTPRVRQGGRGE